MKHSKIRAKIGWGMEEFCLQKSLGRGESLLCLDHLEHGHCWTWERQPCGLSLKITRTDLNMHIQTWVLNNLCDDFCDNYQGSNSLRISSFLPASTDINWISTTTRSKIKELFVSETVIIYFKVLEGQVYWNVQKQLVQSSSIGCHTPSISTSKPCFNKTCGVPR